MNLSCLVCREKVDQTGKQPHSDRPQIPQRKQYKDKTYRKPYRSSEVEIYALFTWMSCCSEGFIILHISMLETKQKHLVVGGRVGVDNVIMLFTAQRLIVCGYVCVFNNYQRA